MEPGRSARSRVRRPSSRAARRSGPPARIGVFGMGLERFWAEAHEDLEELSTSVSEIRAIGDRVFVAATVTGRGKRSKTGFEPRGRESGRGDPEGRLARVVVQEL